MLLDTITTTNKLTKLSSPVTQYRDITVYNIIYNEHPPKIKESKLKTKIFFFSKKKKNPA